MALQAAVQIGWVEETDVPGEYRISSRGLEIRENAERLTDEHFYRPWSVMTQSELDELYDLLVKLKDQLSTFRNAK